MWLYHNVISPKDANGMAISIDPDQSEQSDLGLHCLPRPNGPKTYDHYGNLPKSNLPWHCSCQTIFLENILPVSFSMAFA